MKRLRARWRVVLPVLLVVAGWAGGAIWWRAREAGLPHYEGRSVRSWFRQLARVEEGFAEGFGFNPGGSVFNAEGAEAQLALFEMGTNAVPWLVREALSRPAGLSLRELERFSWLIGRLPRWLREELISRAYRARQGAATQMLRRIRPPAELVLVNVQSELASPNIQSRASALMLLGTFGGDVTPALPYVLTALTNLSEPIHARLAAQSLNWLGTSASNALPAVLSHGLLASPTARAGLRRWLIRLGPAAVGAGALFEDTLNDTNSAERLSAAIVLNHLRPEDPTALRLLAEAANDATLLPGKTSTPQEDLVSWLMRSPTRRCDALIPILEPLARAETDGWTPVRASYRATTALERIAPERAALLYRRALDGRGQLPAAGCLLRVERTNELAAEILARHITRGSDGTSHQAVFWLAEARLGNRTAVTHLEAAARGSDRLLSDAARAALARIRYREARIRRGLGEEWE